MYKGENDMLKRLRDKHPIGYCAAAEVLFLITMMVLSFVVMLGLVLFCDDLSKVDDYILTIIQELIETALAVLLLKKTGKIGLLRQRGSGFFNGLLVGMYPLAIIANSLFWKLTDLPDDPLLPAGRIFTFFLGMTLVGVAEEFLFRGVIAQTLLEHFGTSRAGIWKASLLSALLFGAAHLTNILSSEPFGVLMQCIFAASLGLMLTAIYFRTGNIWVTVFLHAAMDITSMLIGGLYGTQNIVDTVSSYDASMISSIAIYLIPTIFLLRKKKINEVELYFGEKAVKK